MARLEIKMTDSFLFETELTIRTTDINLANHVGNDTFVSLLQEARTRFFMHLGYSDRDIDGKAFVISDLAVLYKSQSYYKDILKFEIGLNDFNKYGCDIFYQVTNSTTNTLVLQAKTGMVFFDYTKNRVSTIPEGFKSRFCQNSLFSLHRKK